MVGFCPSEGEAVATQAEESGETIARCFNSGEELMRGMGAPTDTQTEARCSAIRGLGKLVSFGFRSPERASDGCILCIHYTQEVAVGRSLLRVKGLCPWSDTSIAPRSSFG